MSIITFYTNCKEQTGNTTAAMSLATYLGIVQNKRTLFLSTALNDNTIKNAFWPQVKKKSGLFGPNTSMMSENGIEGLDRIIRSNRISSDIITDYTKVALKDRLEFLLGYKGAKQEYEEIQKQYVQITNMSSKCYDTVIVDIDRQLDTQTKIDLLQISDVVVAMSTQKLDNINEISRIMEEGNILRKNNTLITLGRYDDKSKYNVKNISRNVLRQKAMINCIPYNTLLFETSQEGQVIDMFLKFLNLKGKDENTFFMEEIQRLKESIENKVTEMQQMMR